MIIELRINNCYAFDNEIVFSMKADMRAKRLISNIHMENNFNILKTAGIYGPNNVGKTCMIKCIKAFKNIVLSSNTTELMANVFSNNNISELGMTFMSNGRKFSYDFKTDFSARSFIYERFSELFRDDYGNEKEVCWLLRDVEQNNYHSIDENLNQMMEIVSDNNLLMYLVDTSRFPNLESMKNILINFVNKIDIINMNNIPLEHTIALMKNENNLQQKVVNFIKNADLYLENYEYLSDIQVKDFLNSGEKADEKALDIPEQIMDQIRLFSTYKGHKVPSILFDSTGTKKIAALASYIIEALEKGRILVVDELDSSIHFKLTRAIVSMFNNELNDKAQLIFTVHDINLMDCKKLFRKEQIWFLHRDQSGIYAYSLAEFTASNGVRDTTDIVEKYKNGNLGSLPKPKLIDSLIDLKENNSLDN